MTSTDDKIEQKVKSLKQGAIVFTEDFQDYGSPGAVKVALHRIVKKGLLHNLARGIYAKPTFSTLLNQEVLPATEEVAKAIAKRDKARIFTHRCLCAKYVRTIYTSAIKIGISNRWFTKKNNYWQSYHTV